MARNGWSLATPSKVACTGGTAITVLQFTNPSATIIQVLQQLKVGFDGTSNTATPVEVRLLRKSGVATVTAQVRRAIKDTSTALFTDSANTGYNASAEGTDGNLIEIWPVHPQTGAFDILPLPDGEIEMAGSTTLAVKVLAPATVNCWVTMMGEE